MWTGTSRCQGFLALRLEDLHLPLPLKSGHGSEIQEPTSERRLHRGRLLHHWSSWEAWVDIQRVELCLPRWRAGGSFTNFRLGRCSVYWSKKKFGLFWSLGAKANDTGIICVGSNRNITWICFMKTQWLHEVPLEIGKLEICPFIEMAKEQVPCVCICVVDVF